MAKRIYKLEYKDIVRRSCEKTIPANDIVTAMNWAKRYCKANNVLIGWVHSPGGKRYIV